MALHVTSKSIIIGILAAASLYVRVPAESFSQPAARLMLPGAPRVAPAGGAPAVHGLQAPGPKDSTGQAGPPFERAANPPYTQARMK